VTGTAIQLQADATLDLSGLPADSLVAGEVLVLCAPSIDLTGIPAGTDALRVDPGLDLRVYASAVLLDPGVTLSQITDPDASAGALFVIEGALSARIAELDEVAFSFLGCSAGMSWQMYPASEEGAPLAPVTPVLRTGSDGCPFLGELEVAWPRRLFTGTLHFVVLYADPCDLNKKGRPKIKLTPKASLDVRPYVEFFGQRDDGELESIWKVQNPSGSGDGFNVGFGAPTAQVSMLSGIEAAAWNFAGSAQCWQSVGLYAADLSFDPTGATPDTASPLAELSGAAACVPASQSDWSYPATYYDIPDVAAQSSVLHHAGVRWPAGDTVLWIGADSDGCDGELGALPGSSSFFSADAYATPAISFSAAHWMLKIDWR